MNHCLSFMNSSQLPQCRSLLPLLSGKHWRCLPGRPPAGLRAGAQPLQPLWPPRATVGCCPHAQAANMAVTVTSFCAAGSYAWAMLPRLRGAWTLALLQSAANSTAVPQNRSESGGEPQLGADAPTPACSAPSLSRLGAT